MAIFKRRRKINEDFTYDKLPHNRFEVFKTLFKIRFGFILKVLMLTILFLLPLLVFNTYGRVYINASFSSVSQQKNQIYPQIFGFLLIRTLINIPLFFLSSIGMGGAIRVYRKLTWSEITFLSDYFDNLKINLLRYLFISIVVSLSYGLTLFAIYSIAALNLKPIMIGIMLGISFLQFGFVLTFCFYIYLQNDIYKIRFINLITNSFKFVFKSFLSSLGLLLLLFLPRILIIFGNIYFDLASTLLLLFFLPFILVVLILVGNAQLDKWINKNLYKQIYDKGVYRG
ncbi:MAG TPA: hypothetical protein DD377_00025 [Firmicutes bacterium]|nr:hypothetical protein [Bacillota bacterium]